MKTYKQNFIKIMLTSDNKSSESQVIPGFKLRIWIFGVNNFIFIYYGHHTFWNCGAAFLSAWDISVHCFRERVWSHFWRERSLHLDVKWRDSYGWSGWLKLKCSHDKLNVISSYKYVLCDHCFGGRSCTSTFLVLLVTHSNLEWSESNRAHFW